MHSGRPCRFKAEWMDLITECRPMLADISVADRIHIATGVKCLLVYPKMFCCFIDDSDYPLFITRLDKR